MFMNNTDITKRQLGVTSGEHEQHGPNQKTTGGEPMNNTDIIKRQLKVNPYVHDQHRPNQKTTEGELRCS